MSGIFNRVETNEAHTLSEEIVASTANNSLTLGFKFMEALFFLPFFFLQKRQIGNQCPSFLIASQVSRLLFEVAGLFLLLILDHNSSIILSSLLKLEENK
jgi:hypothetical protein